MFSMRTRRRTRVSLQSEQSVLIGRRWRVARIAIRFFVALRRFVTHAVKLTCAERNAIVRWFYHPQRGIAVITNAAQLAAALHTMLGISTDATQLLAAVSHVPGTPLTCEKFVKIAHRLKARAVGQERRGPTDTELAFAALGGSGGTVSADVLNAVVKRFELQVPMVETISDDDVEFSGSSSAVVPRIAAPARISFANFEAMLRPEPALLIATLSGLRPPQDRAQYSGRDALEAHNRGDGKFAAAEGREITSDPDDDGQSTSHLRAHTDARRRASSDSRNSDVTASNHGSPLSAVANVQLKLLRLKQARVGARELGRKEAKIKEQLRAVRKNGQWRRDPAGGSMEFTQAPALLCNTSPPRRTAAQRRRDDDDLSHCAADPPLSRQEFQARVEAKRASRPRSAVARALSERIPTKTVDELSRRPSFLTIPAAAARAARVAPPPPPLLVSALHRHGEPPSTELHRPPIAFALATTTGYAALALGALQRRMQGVVNLSEAVNASRTRPASAPYHRVQAAAQQEAVMPPPPHIHA